MKNKIIQIKIIILILELSEILLIRYINTNIIKLISTERLCVCSKGMSIANLSK